MKEKQFILEHKLKVASDYESAGHYLHAVQIYTSIIEEYPGLSDVVLKTANLYTKMGNTEAARNSLKDYLADHPESLDIRFFLSEMLINNRLWEEAIENLDSLAPEEEPVAAFLLGYCYFMLKEYEIARINFSKFISLRKDGELYFEACLYAARAEIILKNYEKALPYLKTAEPVLSDRWDFNFYTAQVYFRLGMHAHAVSYIEKAVSMKESENPVYELAGKIYHKLGEYGKAEKYFRRFTIKSENTSADVYALFAECCLNQNKVKQAIELFDRALETDPLNKLAIDGKRNADGIIRKLKAVSND